MGALHKQIGQVWGVSDELSSGHCRLCSLLKVKRITHTLCITPCDSIGINCTVLLSSHALDIGLGMEPTLAQFGTSNTSCVGTPDGVHLFLSLLSPLHVKSEYIKK